jgi:hypothetical protein
LAKPESHAAATTWPQPLHRHWKLAKHRTFQFLDASILPDDKLIAIALDDAFALGVLSSQLHIEWALAQAALGVAIDPVYSKSRCFDTFPFPAEDTGLTPQLRERIAHLAEHIDAHRKRVLGQVGSAGRDFASEARMSAPQTPPAPALPATAPPTTAPRNNHSHSPSQASTTSCKPCAKAAR